ncbi:hypothetical protein Q8A67_005910 [Cirrhinus molitorella]|uniref:TLDc domain-containing protein n=1 Tax=Cirrhinus molitorella TaxID=172907 RepID=A0AA88TVU3_9TELE|nr:hypothetical protein Q8A67_005910 [Cirrhinus molitorella]
MRKVKMHSALGVQSPYNAPLTSSLTEEQRKQLCGLLGKAVLALLYKASVHGYQASAFHQQCDRQGPTLLVAYNRSGYIVSGYTCVDYARSRQKITDDEAFSVHVPHFSAEMKPWRNVLWTTKQREELMEMIRNHKPVVTSVSRVRILMIGPVQEVSSRLGVPVSCVLPVKNYSQELELELNCDVLLLTALQQMLNFADDLDDVGPM